MLRVRSLGLQESVERAATMKYKPEVLLSDSKKRKDCEVEIERTQASVVGWQKRGRKQTENFFLKILLPHLPPVPQIFSIPKPVQKSRFLLSWLAYSVFI